MKNNMKMRPMLLVLAGSLLLTGCGEKHSNVSPAGQSDNRAAAAAEIEINEPVDIGIVLGIRKDFPVPDLTALTPYLQPLIRYGGSLTCTVSDSVPGHNTETKAVSGYGDQRGNALYIEDEINDRVGQLLAYLDTRKAEKSDAAILDAIDLTAEAVREGAASRKLMLVADNGISTAGSLRISSLPLEAEKTAESLGSAYIPDLSGFDVYWFGIGSVDEACYPAGLMKQSTQSLNTLWECIITKGGGTVHFAKGSLEKHGDLPARTLPDVRTVALNENGVEAVPVDVIESFEAPESEKPLPDEAVQLDPKQVSFKPDEWELSDPETTRAYLAPLAQKLLAHPEKRILLIGTIATTTDSPDGGLTFSGKRAESVAEVLIGLGVPQDQIAAAGAGYLDSELIEPDLIDGVRDEEASARNRKVILLDTDTKTAPYSEWVKRYLH